jgi:hypothetical protein
MIYSDKALSQKLERTEARANADFVETRAMLEPASNASWIQVAGAYAMFDGVESPCTQTFGLGMFEEVITGHLEEIESFYKNLDAPVFHEVSPMADVGLINLLNERGYRPVEMTSVMYRALNTVEVVAEKRSTLIKTRVIDESEADLWAKTSATGWSTEMEGLEDFMFGFGRISARCKGAYPFLAQLDGKAISTGMLFIYDDVCVLAGTSTVREARNQGAQNALLSERLKFAADRGCTLAMMAALPGSQSQKNAQKNGFNVAYTRTKWHLTL